MLPAASGAGKSSLASWLADKGFVYLSDEIALLKDATAVIGLSRAVFVKSGAIEAIQALPMCKRVPLVKFGEQLVFVPPSAAREEVARPCGMLVFPQYRAGADLQIEVLSPADAGFRLVACNLNARNFADGGFAEPRGSRAACRRSASSMATSPSSRTGSMRWFVSPSRND